MNARGSEAYSCELHVQDKSSRSDERELEG